MKKLEHLIKESLLKEMSLTPGSDINEIMMGYYLANSSWGNFGNASDAKNTLNARRKVVDQTVYKDQLGRAKVMAQEVQRWASVNGYEDPIQKVWWTARPGMLTQIIGRPIDSKMNPTDILLDFGDGKYLGLSAKSTGKKSGDIGFKNPGMGTLGKMLGIDFPSFISELEQKIVTKYKLPAGLKVRKIFIRENPKIQQRTVEAGTQMLNILRDVLLKKYLKMSQEDLRKHILTQWLNASQVDPYYVKVTGRGEGGKYSAGVYDPINNEKMKALENGKIIVAPAGNDTVSVKADNQRILKIRFKFDSEKLASSIKLSGDPWSGEESIDEENWFRKQTRRFEEKQIDDYKPGDAPIPHYTEQEPFTHI